MGIRRADIVRIAIWKAVRWVADPIEPPRPKAFLDMANDALVRGVRGGRIGIGTSIDATSEGFKRAMGSMDQMDSSLERLSRMLDELERGRRKRGGPEGSDA